MTKYDNQEHLIITYQLSGRQNALVEKALPSSNLQLFSANCYTDIIAIESVAVIIKADKLSEAERSVLFEYYEETGEASSETVFWISRKTPPKHLQKTLKHYRSFSDLQNNLKYLLLEARKKQKKSSEFSNSIMYALRILSAIRKKPGITTQELAENCELSKRSIQRYIETLRLSGEWIEYDASRHGWKLFHGISLLMGDAFPEELDR